MALKLTSLILFSLVFTTPQSFATLKIPFLAVAVVLICTNLYLGRFRVRSIAVLYYYLIFSILVVIWSLIGVLRGNPMRAVSEAMAVYLLYIWIYALLVIYLSEQNYQRIAFPFFSFVSLIISGFCIYMLADYFLQLNWLSPAVREEMYLQIGVHEGYIQMNNINIAMYAFLLPFLISYLLVKESPVRLREVLLIGILIGTVLLASRRAIIALAIVSPAIALVTHLLCGGNWGRVAKRTSVVYILLIVIAVGFFSTVGSIDNSSTSGFADRLVGALSFPEESIRAQQHAAMMDELEKFPFFGSGFGGVADVIRSSERPWNYELTYSRLLFNSGTVGFLLLFLFFGYYIALALRRVRKETMYRDIYVPMLAGYFGVLLAASTNPYLNSFDFVFAFSIVPLILNSPIVRQVHRQKIAASLAWP